MKTAVQKNVVHLFLVFVMATSADGTGIVMYVMLWYAVNRSEMLINIVVNIRFKSKKSAEQTSCITLYFG